MKIFSHAAFYLLIISFVLLSQSVKAQDSKSSIPPPKYKPLELKDAGITIEIPKNWVQQGQKTAWSPDKAGMPLIGFNWKKIPADWEPTNMLPEKSDFLGPFMIDLGWERGLLYIVQTQAETDKVSRFEIHTIVPRMEAQRAYDFYAAANSLSQLKKIEFVNQHVTQSGLLNSFKNYVSKDLEECEDISLDCAINEEEFFDDKGCGCLLAPQTEAVYDN